MPALRSSCGRGMEPLRSPCCRWLELVLGLGSWAWPLSGTVLEDEFALKTKAKFLRDESQLLLCLRQPRHPDRRAMPLKKRSASSFVGSGNLVSNSRCISLTPLQKPPSICCISPIPQEKPPTTMLMAMSSLSFVYGPMSESPNVRESRSSRAIEKLFDPIQPPMAPEPPVPPDPPDMVVPSTDA
ncbi:unnamed protein product [Arabis nemorensis]|uniref:Uncharacterized protein n=1 Tax=Arabis nemorensis TaxID=586526 RepID=A0A565BJ88_9BRAS|nr:unnamed protein product [Arabis nemorensis]